MIYQKGQKAINLETGICIDYWVYSRDIYKSGSFEPGTDKMKKSHLPRIDISSIHGGDPEDCSLIITFEECENREDAEKIAKNKFVEILESWVKGENIFDIEELKKWKQYRQSK